MRSQNERAVSPVVAVMLMLVVTIIIAAVVSGFAGGLVSTNNKAPQATIQAKYSYSANILQMYHAGGDELSTQRIFVVVREKDEEIGGFAGSMSRNSANKSYICNVDSKCWFNPSKGTVSDVPVWRPGETMTYNQTLGFLDSTNYIGKSFILEVDTIDGKLISKTDVKIDP
jgi:archaeal type IV pilus assembly protein PilA